MFSCLSSSSAAVKCFYYSVIYQSLVNQCFISLCRTNPRNELNQAFLNCASKANGLYWIACIHASRRRIWLIDAFRWYILRFLLLGLPLYNLHITVTVNTLNLNYIGKARIAHRSICIDFHNFINMILQNSLTFFTSKRINKMQDW